MMETRRNRMDRRRFVAASLALLASFPSAARAQDTANPIGEPVVPDLVFNAMDFEDGLIPNDPSAASENTGAIVASIAAARAAGGGRVLLPVSGGAANPVWLADSVTESVCLALQETDEDIWIEGLGRYDTYLKVADGLDAMILAISGGKRCVARNFAIDGNSANQPSRLGFHGVRISGEDHWLDNLFITDANGYGVGCAQGSSGRTAFIKRSRFTNLHISRTGADGLDSKDNLGQNEPNVLRNIRVGDFDLHLGGDKAGIDMRGPWLASEIVIDPPAATSQSSGVRFRPGSAGSSLTNARIIGNGNREGEGMEIGGEGNQVSSVVIAGWRVGISYNPGVGGTGLVSDFAVSDCEDGLLLGHSNHARGLFRSGRIRDCTNAVLCCGNEHTFRDIEIRNCTRGYWFNTSINPAWSASRNRVLGGRLVGGFVQQIRCDAGSNDNLFQQVDARRVTSGRFINDATGTNVLDSPGLGDVAESGALP